MPVASSTARRYTQHRAYSTTQPPQPMLECRASSMHCFGATFHQHGEVLCCLVTKMPSLHQCACLRVYIPTPAGTVYLVRRTSLCTLYLVRVQGTHIQIYLYLSCSLCRLEPFVPRTRTMYTHVYILYTGIIQVLLHSSSTTSYTQRYTSL